MSTEDTERRQQFRKMYIKHLETMQMLPADQINAYLEQRENNAAATIQAFWKGCKFRKTLKNSGYGIKENKAATIIQREVRKWLARINKINNMKESEHVYSFNKKKIDELHSKAQKWKEKAENNKACGQKELEKQFHKAQEMLELFYLNRPKRLERIRNIDTLLTKIDTGIVLFKYLPSLEEVTKEDASLFYVSSPTIISKAKLAHEEEMKKLIYPWRRDLTIIDKKEWIDLFPELMSPSLT